MVYLFVDESVFFNVVVASKTVGVDGRTARDISVAETFERLGVGRLDFLDVQIPSAALDNSNKRYFPVETPAAPSFFASAAAARQIGFVDFDFSDDV